MVRILIRIALSALAFLYILPLIHGIQFHGGAMTAVVMAILFAFSVWLVDFIAIALSAVLAIGTLGLALLWLIPLWLLGFWILPAVALRLLSDFMPHYLTVAGWFPAILGSLVLMFIGLITSGSTHRVVRKGV